MTMRRDSLVLRFGILSLLLVGALAAVLAVSLQRSLRTRTLDDARRSAEIAASVGIKPLMRPADFSRGFVPLTADRLAELDKSLKASVSPGGFVRLKVWNREHWIVYSDNARLNNRWFPSSVLLDQAFSGNGGSELTDLTAPEELEERSFGKLLAVYVPLRVDAAGAFTSTSSGQIVGALELYLPYAPIGASIRSASQELYSTVAVGLMILYLALFRLVLGASRQLRRQADDNRHQAEHDALTGLANRVLFRDQLVVALRDARRHGRTVAVLLADLDRFKEINDTLGHHCGDQLLIEAGRRLSTRVRATDVVARLGGDEFAIVLRNVADEETALRVARYLALDLARPVDIEGLQLEMHASIGVAMAPRDGEDADKLLQRADVAMYVAKRQRSGCLPYRPELDHYSPDRLRLAGQVRAGIEGGEFFLVYQPKVSMHTGHTVGFEALVRWMHPERGQVSPGEFMPVVENTELIGQFTLHLIDLALQQWKQWDANGVGVPIAVNLSARNLSDRRFADQVLALLAHHDAPPRALEVELTESAVLDNPDVAREVLLDLQNAGIHIALDDFGTGYASLAYIASLPIDVIKIDQSFAGRVLDDRQAEAIVKFSVGLGRSLNLTVVAEGIETVAVLERLTDMGCDVAQGYFLSRPLPAPDALGWLLSMAGSSSASLPRRAAGGSSLALPSPREMAGSSSASLPPRAAGGSSLALPSPREMAGSSSASLPPRAAGGSSLALPSPRPVPMNVGARGD